MRAPLRLAAIAAASALVPAFLTSTASADSLVYMNGGNVWIAHGDGSNARQVTGAPNTWSWPSEDDHGNILVAGGPDSGSNVFRLNQQGASVSSPQQTPGDFSTSSCPTGSPRSLRVAPDGAHYAYDSFFCDHFITQIGTIGGNGFSGSEYMSDFQFPYWVDNTDFAVSRGGEPLQNSDGEWWTHDLGDQAGYGYNWFGDPDNYASSGGWATGFDGIAVSRDGSKVATVEDDGGNWVDSRARNVAIRLWSASGAPTPRNETPASPTFKCQLTLPADPDETFWYYSAGPTFSPDGTKLAFAEPDGIHVANVPSLSSCPTSAPLVIPGATQPSWSAADEAANAGYVAPPPPGNDNGNNNGPAADTTAPAVSGLAVTPKRFAVAKAATATVARKKTPKGTIVRYTLSEPARVTFTISHSTAGRKKGHACVKATKKNRHAAHCTRTVLNGTLTRSGLSGGNQLGFSGRIGKHALAPGGYKLTVRATDGAGNRSAAKTATFTVAAH